MGGKAQRRREKNYLAAHGGNRTLPPAPKASDLDAVPAKLRSIMKFKNSTLLQDPDKLSKDKTRVGKREGDRTVLQKKNPKDDKASGVVALDHMDDSEDISNTKGDIKKKKKHKRKTFDDLRLQMMNKELAGSNSNRRERRKKYLEEKKKKHKKAKTDEGVDFPQHEKIKFGEVVEAPPKLTFPKVSKTFRDASHERLRLEAVDAYRNHKGWTSRPGISLPSLSTTVP
ncbi:hypothetical protein H6P81_016486 [Aristolochia fimbriata]|uniref:Coiled-coil domain-containing protein 137 n=1 Tax=Aristolochia fimbriata TaxID=158543 RepID=A0AAV7E9Q9_ARIFI|nr:hypothetical protein H6P81_016486 [Aristolochia fimbriata]